ncbi:acyltransferase [Rhizobium sp. RU36D]|uniref:acyltransferase family protein n=1 Tax=Rhizobium sp. RU36D TaxID=1907415 RepID=UPI0009D83E0B|nr:acyltransferase [Rhizobium sp. RU36D]SMD20072.1 Peptidoglycan/LPS O-acetylase OafA/YrhL, contains acyltransferase and SGNH-hydrolase domains [Rhizobium sp. RU36D]
MTKIGEHPTERLHFLDGWRGIAILAVMIGHFFPVPGMDIGSFGVELFFVLSGRLMAEILFVRKVEALEFLRRRISRIYPALLVFVLCVSIPALLSVQLMDTREPLAQVHDIIAALTFTTNYTEFFFYRGLAFGHTWSLAVEEHSYLILLVLAWFTRRNARLALYFMVGATILCVINGLISSHYFGQREDLAYWRTDVRIASILISASIYLAIREFDLRRFMHPATTLLAVPVALILFTDDAPGYIKYGVVTLMLAWCVNALDVAPAFVRNALSVRPLVSIGLISYSLYLWQQPFYAAAGPFREKGVIYIIVLVIAAFCCAIGSYVLIEGPARRFINGIDLRRRRARRPSSGTVEWFGPEPARR